MCLLVENFNMTALSSSSRWAGEFLEPQNQDILHAEEMAVCLVGHYPCL